MQPNTITSYKTAYFFIISLIFLFSLPFAHAHQTSKVEKRPFIILKSLYGMGFFEDFMTALGALHCYEQGLVCGVSAEYGESGTYFDPDVGPNWWEYYFKPLKIGKKRGDTCMDVYHSMQIGETTFDLPRIIEFTVYRKDVYALIKQYVHIKKSIKNKVKAITQESFGQGKVIGVHYRGTDKYLEDPLAPFELVIKYVDEALITFAAQGHDAKIYVATDQQTFLDHMLMLYPGRVIFYAEGDRSVDGQPVHFSPLSGYKKGEDALIECLLLAKTDLLIKTSSNLSLCSSYFNPKVKVIHATHRHWRPPLE